MTATERLLSVRRAGLVQRLDDGLATRAIVILAAAFWMIMPQLRYQALHTGFYDLGQYASNYSNVAFDGLWSTAAGTHLHLPMLLFAPLYRVFPSPATLLFLQSAFLIAGQLTYVRLWRLCDAGPSWIGAALYALSLPIWFSALVDYHFEHLLPLLFILYAIEMQRKPQPRSSVLIALALALCSVKEIYALSAVMLGALTALRPGQRLVGLLIASVSLVYFAAAMLLIIPAFTDGRHVGELWNNAFGYLGNSPGEMLRTLILRPWIFFQSGNFARKALFIGALFAPVFLLVRRADVWLLPALPPLAIVLLSRNEAHVYLGHQYSVAVALPLMIAIMFAFSHAPDAARRHLSAIAIGASVVVLVLFGPSPISRLFFSRTAWTVNSAAYMPTERDRRIKTLIATHVPSDRRVVVSAQGTLHFGLLTHRTHTLTFPGGIDRPMQVARNAALLSHGKDNRLAPDGQSYAALAAQGLILADIVILDWRRPWMNYDSYCAYDASNVCADPVLRQTYRDGIDRLTTHFVRLTEDDGFEIWARKR